MRRNNFHMLSFQIHNILQEVPARNFKALPMNVGESYIVFSQYTFWALYLSHLFLYFFQISFMYELNELNISLDQCRVTKMSI